MARELRSCPECGGSVRWVERSADETPNDHHNNVYRCGECGRRIVAG